MASNPKAAAPRALSVMLHAWRNDEYGNCEYCEPDDSPDGWCVYTRTDFDLAGDAAPFDISEETDFPDYQAALSHAQERAARLGVEVQEY